MSNALNRRPVTQSTVDSKDIAEHTWGGSAVFWKDEIRSGLALFCREIAAIQLRLTHFGDRRILVTVSSYRRAG
jgi:hypothetical protein